jgi:hypothetical protein
MHRSRIALSALASREHKTRQPRSDSNCLHTSIVLKNYLKSKII